MGIAMNAALPPEVLQPETDPGSDPLGLVRLVVRHNLHPEDDLHPSWLPADWPARHRSHRRLGPAGRALLARLLLRRQQAAGLAPDFNFDSRLKRLALLDGGSLRRLAWYCGLCVHLPLLRQRSPLGGQLRRQARRLDEDSVDFLLDRAPHLTELQLDAGRLKQHPHGAGRVVAERGARLLLAMAAREGEHALLRIQHKLPRPLSALPRPALTPPQARQLDELMLLCIVPERLPQWDWLF